MWGSVPRSGARSELLCTSRSGNLTLPVPGKAFCILITMFISFLLSVSRRRDVLGGSPPSLRCRSAWSSSPVCSARNTMFLLDIQTHFCRFLSLHALSLSRLSADSVFSLSDSEAFPLFLPSSRLSLLHQFAHQMCLFWVILRMHT